MKTEMYRVVSAPTIEELVKQVNEMILEGFEPIGGVGVETNMNHVPWLTKFYQAMIL